MTVKPNPSCCPTKGKEMNVEMAIISCEPSSVTKASSPVKHALVDLMHPEFLMGDAFQEGYAGDGEGPQRSVSCESYSIGTYAISNGEFNEFIKDTAYITDAEKFGWSFVFYDCVSHKFRSVDQSIPTTPWWLKVNDAFWAAPEGPESNILTRLDHPVTHISWFDAKAYCHWSGTRLPTEAEWEYAARGGLEGNRYSWGNNLESNGEHHCNIWQGSFPDKNTAEDGYRSTAPVTAFEANGLGLYNVCGNVWEWCEDWFTPAYHNITKNHNPLYISPSGNRSMRGGSFLCHETYCNRYRVAARSSNSPDTTTNNCGFRIVIDL